ncbi:MAG: DEAD/DEAH box helicase family protein, partial [Alicyclobacillus macrosporangiidus]|uniref:DEAD/DEAH box helicase family protein n=1 Tax=Alicyclobacillus macrosporangiidus TaxID=392015 RepID=UPI0026F2CE56
MAIQLRPYQQEAVEAFFNALPEHKRQLIVLPTGAGKTIVFGATARRYYETVSSDNPILVIAHRTELLDQAEQKIQYVWPGVVTGRVQGQRNEQLAQVLIASTQTLVAGRTIPKPGLIIYDECHHSRAEGALGVLQRLGVFEPDGPPLLGVTATPSRSDRTELGDVFEHLTYERTILQMIMDGYLADVRGIRVEVPGLNLSAIRTVGGDYNAKDLSHVMNIEEALEVFSDYVNGVVVWSENLPCTSNIASTICGVENLLPVRYSRDADSMYDRLVLHGPKLKIVHNLVGKFTGRGKIPDSDLDSTGSRKGDAYLWAKMRYIDTGKCNPCEIGYWCDAFWLKHPSDMSLSNVGLTNHDYIVARKGFVCDLDVWPDEAPRDDPDQKPGLDREVFKEILLSCYNRANGKMIHVSGFTPWAIKYTSFGKAGGKHEEVPTEWKTVQLL